MVLKTIYLQTLALKASSKAHILAASTKSWYSSVHSGVEDIGFLISRRAAEAAGMRLAMHSKAEFLLATISKFLKF